VKNAVQVGTRRGFRAFYNIILFNLDTYLIHVKCLQCFTTWHPPVVLACIATRLAKSAEAEATKRGAPEHLSIPSAAVRLALQPLTTVIQGQRAKHGLKRTERIIDLRAV
jgi:hypothetical protein